MVNWSKQTAYSLGRLFALYELVELASGGGGFHAAMLITLYREAASQPHRIFPLLDKRCEIHFTKFGSDRIGLQLLLQTKASKIRDSISKRQSNRLPTSLTEDQQDFFLAGYCYQRCEFFGAPDRAGKSRTRRRSSAPVRGPGGGGREELLVSQAR